MIVSTGITKSMKRSTEPAVFHVCVRPFHFGHHTDECRHFRERFSVHTPQ